MKNLNKTISQRLKQARLNRGFKQKELAIKLGISDKTISAYEKGRILPPVDILYQASAELKVPLTYFLPNQPKLERSIIDLSSQVKNLEKEIKKLSKTTK